MIVDSSALMAILDREPEVERLLEVVATGDCRIPASTLGETLLCVGDDFTHTDAALQPF